MSEQRQISSYMEKEKNMDKRPSSHTFSMDSLTPEINNIPVSGFITHTSLDDDELMQCDDLLDKKELTCFNIHETMSLESRSLLSGSWSCSTDSVLSEVITSFDQDVNEVIKAVCQSFFENMETEAVNSEVKEDVQSTESISTSRLTTGSDKSLSSSSTETVIAEAAKTIVSLVIDEAVKELDATEAAKMLISLVIDEAVKELDATEAAKTPKDIGSLKTLQSTDCEKVLEDTDTLQRSQRKRCRDQRKVHPAPHSYLDEAVRSPSTDWTIFCTGESKQGSCGSQETTTFTSSSGDESADLRPIQQDLVDCTADEDPTRVEKTKAKKSNRFFDFFRNVFSKVRMHLRENS
ncbi:hypothetical protein D5F01_LYC06888 [Larimichthys crocea]|uniref:Uncharacterized protein n=1 Tax=Larimichthys crocea TaxID=215358 RepID=A0A6G0IRT4_LARCR|nr:hypothetical protein D5F01_LYC06888 [Larimichthys crocea]